MDTISQRSLFKKEHYLLLLSAIIIIVGHMYIYGSLFISLGNIVCGAKYLEKRYP